RGASPYLTRLSPKQRISYPAAFSLDRAAKRKPTAPRGVTSSAWRPTHDSTSRARPSAPTRPQGGDARRGRFSGTFIRASLPEGRRPGATSYHIVPVKGKTSTVTPIGLPFPGRFDTTPHKPSESSPARSRRTR